MIISFSDSEVIEGNKSIFLAGPTIRNVDMVGWQKGGWRKEALEILKELGFDGVVYVPEFETPSPELDYKKQTHWEWNALHNSTVIVFWIPRIFPDLPALTTNVEFGYYLGIGKNVVYGRPDNAHKVRYLDMLYDLSASKKPFNSLRETLEVAIKETDKKIMC